MEVCIFVRYLQEVFGREHPVLFQSRDSRVGSISEETTEFILPRSAEPNFCESTTQCCSWKGSLLSTYCIPAIYSVLVLMASWISPEGRQACNSSSVTLDWVRCIMKPPSGITKQCSQLSMVYWYPAHSQSHSICTFRTPCLTIWLQHLRPMWPLDLGRNGNC